MLRFGIERARRLVEQQDRRVAQNGAGDRKALTLPAREAHAFLAEKGSEAAWQGIKELGRMRRLGGGADPPLCAPRSAEADILPRIGAEDHRILRHQSDAVAHLGRIGGAQIDPIDTHRAIMRSRRGAAGLLDRPGAACVDWRVWPKPTAQYRWRVMTCR